MSQTSDVEHLYQDLLTNGYCVVEQGVGRQTAREVKESMERFFRRNSEHFSGFLDANGHFPRLINMHLANPDLLRLFSENATALAIQDRFFNSESTIYTSLYFEYGSQQAIHRDTPYFCTKPELRYLGVWVALEEVDDQNGCLEVIPGGHRIPELDRKAIGYRFYADLDEVEPYSTDTWETYQDLLHTACKDHGLEKAKVPLQAGDTVIWHPQLPHGGSMVLDRQRTRHSFVMHVTPKGTPVYQQNVFFNPEREFPTEAGWSYQIFGGRQYVDHGFVDIAHRKQLPPSAFALK